MREDKQFKKAVDSRLQPLLGDISKELKDEFPEAFEDEKQKARSAQNRKRSAVGALGALAAVAICVAVILPCALLLPSVGSFGAHHAPGDGDNSHIPVPSDEEYRIVKSELTVKQYNEANGTNILYFDFYADAASYRTDLIVSDGGSTLGIEEKFVNAFGGYTVALRSDFKSAPTSILGKNFDKCTQAERLENCEIKWAAIDGDCYGLFDYDGRRYGLTVDNCSDENKLFELTEKLFE